MSAKLSEGERMKLVIINRSSRPMPRGFLQSWVKAMAKAATQDIPAKKFRGKELVIVFLAEAEARQLNKRFRGKDYATDVLSFQSDDDASALGELVICPHVISRQAREHGLLVREELGYMVLHGFLHLLGYDHERSRKEAARMFKLQDRLFDQLLSRRF